VSVVGTRVMLPVISKGLGTVRETLELSIIPKEEASTIDILNPDSGAVEMGLFIPVIVKLNAVLREPEESEFEITTSHDVWL